MSTIKPASDAPFDAQTPLLIVGAGAAGLCAALAAKEAGVEPLVIERDAGASGSTSLSAGLIPAAGTRFQRAKGIADSHWRLPPTYSEKPMMKRTQPLLASSR